MWVVAILLWLMGMLVLYMVIKAAVDNSRVVILLTEIRDLLKMQETKRSAIDIHEVEGRSDDGSVDNRGSK